MEEIDLKEIFNFFRSKIVLILGILVIVLFVGNMYNLSNRKAMYKSDTSIVLVSENTSYTQSDYQLNQHLVKTYSEIIKSRTVLGKVIDSLGLDYSVNELSKNVDVSAKTDTDMIVITVVDENPDRAKKIANELAVIFSEEVQEIYHLENVTIMDRAIAQDEPYNLTYVKDNVIYTVVGLLVGFSITFIMFYFDTTIKSSESIEDKFGLPVLGVVPLESRGK